MAQNKYVVNISGKDYLTVAGRVHMAHESGRLLGADMNIVESFDGPTDPGYITVRAKVRVLNERNIPTVEKLLKAVGGDTNWAIADTIKSLLVNEFDGIAKSPKEGSEAWKQLPPRSPERSNPTEVCATSALGRALGAAGFGDSESFATADEVFVAQSRQEGYATAPASTGYSNGNGALKDQVQNGSAAPRTASPNKPPSDKQKKYLQTLSKQKLGIQTPAEFAGLVTTKFGKTIDELSSLDVSNWINELAEKEA